MKKEVEVKINWEIKSETVRLVGDNVTPDVYTLKDAIKIAKELNLDLVEINSNSTPCICKIVDYDKFVFDQKRKQQEIEKKNRLNASETKEIRFTPNTGEHDYEFKKKHILGFLTDGDKVKVVVKFKGREMNYQEQGQVMMLKLADELSHVGVVERMPSMEGTNMIMYIRPKK